MLTNIPVTRPISRVFCLAVGLQQCKMIVNKNRPAGLKSG